MTGVAEVSPRVASLLAEIDASDTLAAARALVALEQLGDPSAIEPLRAWISTAPERLVIEAHRTLCGLTGREPVIGGARGLASPAEICSTWATTDLAKAPRPRLERVELWGTLARLDVVDGAGLIALSPQPTEPPSQWPRWYIHLLIGGQHVYRVGSICGTCETALLLLGWPDATARALASDVRAELADVDELTPELLEVLGPLLHGMRSGHYRLALVDVDLERVLLAARSWFVRCRELREIHSDEPFTSVLDGTEEWKGFEHRQARTILTDDPPTFLTVVPTAPFESLDEATVAQHEAAIRAGARPAAIVTAWLEEKHVWFAEGPERFLLGAVLDGHHKLEAYERAGVPARLVLVCRVEDSSDPDVLDGVLELLFS